tara:strand:- start:1069 stop:1239 length:171 start_codon:yes stop_codon:yes gene_type:complete
MSNASLWLCPNGHVIRSVNKPEGGKLVIEPELPKRPEVTVIDQTEAVLKAEQEGLK